MNTSGPIKLFAAGTVAALIAAFAQPSLAQDDSPQSRAEVKAQTRAANKSRALLPAGEAPLPEKPFQSTKTRTDRKAETLTARRRGELLTPGEANYKAQLSQPLRTDRTRAERKAETRQAAKDGLLLPAGEGEDPAKAARRK